MLLLTACKSSIQYEYGNSDVFEHDDRRAAMAVIEAVFHENIWADCTLKSITYTDDEASKEKGDYYGHEEAMAFLIDFISGDHEGSSLNPNSEYQDYQMLVYRNVQGNWSIDWSGCGYG